MRLARRSVAYLAAVLWAWVAIGQAAERQLQISPTAPPPSGEKRVALIIGNSAYRNSPLKNPVNDARAISKALAATGFKVTVIEDATAVTMRRVIRGFGNEIQHGAVGLFYFAGHGMQVKGKNYLIPVNADIEAEDEIEDQAVDANLVLSKMDSAKNSLNLMILDACRNNPFQRSFRSGAQGLAQMDAPSGTLIAFATAPGAVAADGDGANGLYTKHLLAHLNRPGLPIEQLFKEVRIGVTRETASKQVPWESSSLTGNFYFVPAKAEPTDEERKREFERVLEARIAADRAEQQRQMEKTIQQRLAAQRAEYEEELRKQAAAAAKPTETPKPVEAPKPAPVQVASVAPTQAAGSGISNPRFPKVGDRWDYNWVDTTSQQRRLMRFEVMGVSTDGILEKGGFVDAELLERAHAPGPQLIFTPGGGLYEFSPFLLSFGSPKEGEWWQVPPPRNWGFCFLPGNSCHIEGRVLGAEKVTTPAGTFDTVKVLLDINTRGGSTGAWRQLTYWYADSVKRIVKANNRDRRGNATAPNYDLELTAYKLH